MSETLPDRAKMLFWTPAEQAYGYKNVDKVFRTNAVAAGDAVLPLPAGEPLEVRYQAGGEDWDLERYIEANQVHGVLVLQDGKVRLERYAKGFTATDRWISFSVAKSFTSTLVGCAIEDGAIAGLDALVTDYIPELAGSGYDGVSVRQVLTMTSGVAWSEDYADPNSDVARCGLQKVEPHQHPTIEYMKRLGRANPPGTFHRYSTGETDLIGILVMNATGKSLADYLSEKLWKPFGMEAEARWVTDNQGRERGGSGLFARMRDYGRMGMFMLGGGVAGGKRVVPEGWVEAATTSQIPPQELVGGGGYGYQWWTNWDGTFRGSGVFGQGLFVDPATKLVIVTLSTWPKATDLTFAGRRLDFVRGVRESL
jgi:CubicO group peptidase (beta-lactamase class C family)